MTHPFFDPSGSLLPLLHLKGGQSALLASPLGPSDPLALFLHLPEPLFLHPLVRSDPLGPPWSLVLLLGCVNLDKHVADLLLLFLNVQDSPKLCLDDSVMSDLRSSVKVVLKLDTFLEVVRRPLSWVL